jgi:integrase/recombinase XerD
MEALYDLRGNRLYLTDVEREAFLKAALDAPGDVRSFCEVLHFTGCMISEALNLQPRFIDLDQKVIVFETLKRRQKVHFREVPVPDRLIETLVLVHGLRESKIRAEEQLWSWSRTTAWRKVTTVMEYAHIHGAHASPKGLRHGYGIAGISAGVPLNLLSKWMGHSKIETTAIYASDLGEEQRQIAARMWSEPL